MPTFGTTDAGKAFAQAATLEVFFDRFADNRAPEAVLVLEPFGVDAFELVEVVLDKTIEGRLPRLARAREPGLVLSWTIHGAPRLQTNAQS